MDEIRAFIALELPSEIKSALTDRVSRLQTDHERSVKWVNPQGIHLTLKFLGNIPSGKAIEIAKVMEQVTSEQRPFTLELGNIGAFPNTKSPRVIWIGLGGDVSNVIRLQKQLEQSLVTLGFPVEKRVFSPHLTLGRIRDSATSNERFRLSASMTSAKPIIAPAFTTNRLTLMKSTLTREGAIYDCLAGVSLGRDNLHP